MDTCAKCGWPSGAKTPQQDAPITVETWTHPDDGVVHVAVTVGGGRHHRALNPRSDGDHQALKIADGFWRHAELIASLDLSEVRLTEQQRRAAVLVDQCLAIEQIFPHLRELLPP